MQGPFLPKCQAVSAKSVHRLQKGHRCQKQAESARCLVNADLSEKVQGNHGRVSSSHRSY